MPQQLFSRLPTALRRGGAALGLLAFAAAPADAQIVVEDFESGFADEFVFSGGENGTLTLSTDTFDGSAQSASFFADADEIGGFTGFGQPIAGGPVDLSDVDNGVLVFDVAASGTFTLEINFQNTGGGGEGEIRNALRFTDADGTYQRFRLPLSSFFPTNDATFELDDVAQYVWTILDATGDGDGGTNETGFLLDNIQVVEGLGFENAIVAESFDSGDFSDANGYFYFSGGEGIAASATTDTPDGSANAFAGSLNPSTYGGFAGFGATFADAPIDATTYDSFNFFLRTSGAGRIEVNLQTDAAAGGNEIRESFLVSDTDGDYRQISIPLEAFIQSSANPANLASVFNYVLTFVELEDGQPFTFAIDAIGFGSQSPPVSSESLPTAFDTAPRAYPNPTASSATIAFELAEATDVTVDVVDLLGRRVATLAAGAQAAGPVRVAMPTVALAPGLYVVRVQTDSGVATTRVSVVR